ncbi:CBS domain-containing protein [Streptomyces thinghirensis]|nr:CBS domain-containing protein [Streptomyces thinghirensis]
MKHQKVLLRSDERRRGPRQRGLPFKEIAHLLQEYDITAVPVVDEGEQNPVGVVSRRTLLQKMWGGDHGRSPEDGRGSRPAGGKASATRTPPGS